MQNVKPFIAVVLTAILAHVGATSAVTIGFEGLAAGTVVTNQFPEVTFSSDAGFVNRVVTNAGAIGAKFICTGGTNSAIDCLHDTILTFTNPVNGLSFWMIGNDDGGTVAFVDVNTTGANTVVPVLGTANPNKPNAGPAKFLDFSAFSNVTSIRMHDISDEAGLGWDEFSFTAAAIGDPTPTPAPEPATILLLSVALAGVGASRRWRRS